VNERLRRALNEAGLDIDDLARATGASHDTARRWITPGRTPQRRYRVPIVRLLKRDEADLWPELAVPTAEAPTSEVVNVYPSRSHVPSNLWLDLLRGAQEEIELLGSALLWLFELPGFLDHFWEIGCEVRIVLADPDSRMVVERDEELGLEGTLADRIRVSLRHLKRVQNDYKIDVRLHTTPMYCSLFHADNEMLVMPHLYRRVGRLQTPVLHLRRDELVDGIFLSYFAHFDDVFNHAAPLVGSSPDDDMNGTSRPWPDLDDQSRPWPTWPPDAP
jgi:hypothetical protein